MGIDWLDAVKAVDSRKSLSARRLDLEAELAANPDSRDSYVELLEVMAQLECEPADMITVGGPGFDRFAEDAEMLAWLGWLALRSGDYQLAKLSLDRALEADTDQPFANYSMSQLHFGSGGFKAALKSIEAARKGAEGKHWAADAERLYCICLARLERYDEAYEVQAAILNAEPDNTRALIDTADLLEAMGRLKESWALLEGGLKRNDADTDLLFRAALFKFEHDRPAESLAFGNRLLEVDGQHLEGWNLRAQVKFKLADYEGALSDHEMIRELSRSIPLDQAFRAQCLASMGRKSDAIAALKQGIEESKRFPDQQKRYRRALEALQVEPPAPKGAVPSRSMKAAPNDPCPCGSGKKFKKCHGRG